MLFPHGTGPFIRRARDAVGYERELVVGQWGLIPWFAKEPKPKYPTNNARSEELADKASYKQPWARGQRCIIPAADFDEPNWETGKDVWWRFKRADGAPWGLAGLWNTWTDKTTGELHESYTMLTLNADEHPLLRRMYKPNPKRPADAQDKRSVVPIEASDVDTWLAGTVQEATKLVQLASVEVFEAKPLIKQIQLPRARIFRRFYRYVSTYVLTAIRLESIRGRRVWVDGYRHNANASHLEITPPGLLVVKPQTPTPAPNKVLCGCLWLRLR